MLGGDIYSQKGDLKKKIIQVKNVDFGKARDIHCSENGTLHDTISTLTLNKYIFKLLLELWRKFCKMTGYKIDIKINYTSISNKTWKLKFYKCLLKYQSYNNLLQHIITYNIIILTIKYQTYCIIHSYVRNLTTSWTHSKLKSTTLFWVKLKICMQIYYIEKCGDSILLRRQFWNPRQSQSKSQKSIIV